jgi:hypothetical protein
LKSRQTILPLTQSLRVPATIMPAEQGQDTHNIRLSGMFVRQSLFTGMAPDGHGSLWISGKKACDQQYPSSLAMINNGDLVYRPLLAEGASLHWLRTEPLLSWIRRVNTLHVLRFKALPSSRSYIKGKWRTLTRTRINFSATSR